MTFDELFHFMLRRMNSEDDIAETIRIRDEWIANHPETDADELELIQDFDDVFANEALRLQLEENGKDPKVMSHQQLMYLLLYGWSSGEEAVETARIRDEWISLHPNATEDELDQIYSVGDTLLMVIEGDELKKAGKFDSEGNYIG